MRSKGFTLIELLAVIVILAIIALIAVPIVLNIINNSKEQSVKISAEHYFDAVEQAIAREYLKDSTVNLDGTYGINEKGKKLVQTDAAQGETTKQINIEYDGETVESGTIVIGDGKVESAENLKINNYNVKLESGKIEVSKDGSSNSGESGTTGLAAGLYDENGNLITSWDDLVDSGTIILSEDDKAITDCDTNISGKLIIDASITSIGDLAFAHSSNLTSVTIPNSVTSIGMQSFCDCENLMSVTIPNSIINMGHDIFLNSGLTSVTIEDGVTSISNGMFQSTNLTEVIIPDSVTSIGSTAFYDCNGLTEVIIPNSVTSIGGGAFSWCNNLTAIILGNNVTVESGAFSGVPTVYYAGYEAGVDYSSWGVSWGPCQVLPLQSGGNESEEPDEPDISESSEAGLYAPDGTFTSWVNLTTGDSPIIPVTGGTIGQISTTNKEKLAGKLVISSDITSIDDYAFSATGLTTVTIPDSVTSIGFYAFNNCNSLTEVTIPSSVTSIGDDAFGFCYSLIATILGNNVTIGNYAFNEAPIVYYAGYQEGVSYSSWCVGQVLPLQ